MGSAGLSLCCGWCWVGAGAGADSPCLPPTPSQVDRRGMWETKGLEGVALQVVEGDRKASR